MLSVMDVVAYVKTVDAETAYYPNNFSLGAPSNAGYVRLYSGRPASEWTPKKYPTVQVVIRADHPSVGEAKANDIYTHLHNRRQFDVGQTRIISATADQSAPLYLGSDENGRFLYSVNFTMVTL